MIEDIKIGPKKKYNVNKKTNKNVDYLLKKQELFEPPEIDRYIFNRFSMPLLIEIDGKDGIMLCPREYVKLDEGDKFSDSTSKLFSMGHIIIIAKSR